MSVVGQQEITMTTSNSLNSKQVDLLKFIAKYRFITVAQVQKTFNLSSRPSVNLKLNVLVRSGHLEKLYDSTYKLAGKPAVFFLTPEGLREAQKHLPYITDSLIRNSYSDKRASDSLVQESARILELCEALTQNYPGIKALTARQLADIDYMPRPLPNIYLAHQTGDHVTRYFLYYFQDVKRYDVAVNAKIAQLMKYRESGNYDQSGNNFPTILLVCDSAAIERLAQRTMLRVLNKSYESIHAYTTSLQSLLRQSGPAQSIWSSVDEPGTLVTLGDIEADS